MPYSTFNIKKFNVGKLNIDVPWEFWNELNNYYARTQNSCIFVGELIDNSVSYKIISNYTLYTITDKYFMYIIPALSLNPQLTDDIEPSMFGYSNNINPRGEYNIKKIIYAKIDESLDTNKIHRHYINSFIKNCSNLEYICTKGWIVDDKYKDSNYQNLSDTSNIINGANKLKSIDLSFCTFNYTQNGIHSYTKGNTFSGSYSSLTYIRYGSGWFNATLHNVAKTYICTYINLNKQHYDDLIADLPDLTGVEISNASYKTLTIGDNFDDWDKLPQTSRDAILAKGWIISKN